MRCPPLLLLLVLITLAGVFLSTPTVRAANGAGDCTAGSNFLSLPTWYEYLDVDDECNVSAKKDTNTGEVDLGVTVGAILLAVTEILLRIAGIVAIGFVVYGGVMYTTSQGAPDKTAAAKNTITNALIGLAVAVLAVSIVNLLTNILIG